MFCCYRKFFFSFHTIGAKYHISECLKIELEMERPLGSSIFFSPRSHSPAGQINIRPSTSGGLEPDGAFQIPASLSSE